MRKGSILGYDLNEKYCQISYYDEKKNEPETLEISSGNYQIPLVLGYCDDEWIYGRSAELLALEAEMSRKYRESFLGQETEVLLEEPVTINGEPYMIGHTKEYVKVVVPFDETRPELTKNSFVTGIMKEFLTDEVIKLA